MLWLAPAGLRGGLKLEAYHQSRQPQSFFLCGPRCSGTSDRCSGRCGVMSYALLRQPYLRPHHCGDLGFVSRHMPAEHRIPDVLAAPDVEASCITSCRGRRVSFSERRCGVTACLQSRRRQPGVAASWRRGATGFCRLSRQLLACRGRPWLGFWSGGRTRRPVRHLRFSHRQVDRGVDGLSDCEGKIDLLIFVYRRLRFPRVSSRKTSQHPEEVAGQLFLEGKKQRVVNIVTVALPATAGLRGGQILEASSSTYSASHTLLPSASAAPPRFLASVKGLASRKECRLVSRRSCTVLYIF